MIGWAQGLVSTDGILRSVDEADERWIAGSGQGGYRVLDKMWISVHNVTWYLIGGCGALMSAPGSAFEIAILCTRRWCQWTTVEVAAPWLTSVVLARVRSEEPLSRGSLLSRG